MTEHGLSRGPNGALAPAGFTALECRVGLGRISIAADAIDVLGEYAVGARLPLTGRLGYAVGVWEGEVVLSLSVARGEVTTARTTCGLLLAMPGGAIRWAFEIVAPIGLVEVVSVTPPQSTASPWLRTATLARGGALQFMDVRALIAAVAPELVAR